MKRFEFLLLTVALLGASPALAATFNHAEHDRYVGDVACETCHKQVDASIVPETQVCLACHKQSFVDKVELPQTETHGPIWALYHRPYAKGADANCVACHEQSYCLDCHKSGFADEQGEFTNNMINVHRSDFQVSHPIAARTDPQLCASCHESRFCTECHEQFAPADLSVESHRRGWRNITAGGAATHADILEISGDSCESCHPDSVLPSHDWSASHAREARKNLATCQACHPEGDICLKCHSARSGLMVSPHPSDWDDIDGRLRRASDGKTCRKCH